MPTGVVASLPQEYEEFTHLQAHAETAIGVDGSIALAITPASRLSPAPTGNLVRHLDIHPGD